MLFEDICIYLSVHCAEPHVWESESTLIAAVVKQVQHIQRCCVLGHKTGMAVKQTYIDKKLSLVIKNRKLVQLYLDLTTGTCSIGQMMESLVRHHCLITKRHLGLVQFAAFVSNVDP